MKTINQEHYCFSQPAQLLGKMREEAVMPYFKVLPCIHWKNWGNKEILQLGYTAHLKCELDAFLLCQLARHKTCQMMILAKRANNTSYTLNNGVLVG